MTIGGDGRGLGRERPIPIPPAGIDRLDGERFDAVVIGGGVLGVGVARELARRGRRCLLVERRDFGSGTTARSTRLIHGGLRYLANYDFGLVREGLRERAWQLRVVPNLVAPLAFILPFYGTPLWQRLRLRAGLMLYDLLSPRGSLPRHLMVSAEQLAVLEPRVRRQGLHGAGMYWDAQLELPERLVVEALRAAGEAGATVRNHVESGRLVRDGSRAAGLELIDTRGGGRASVRTSMVVNASGPWADETLARLGIRREPLLRLTQGIHLVFPPLASRAISFEHPDDARLCFAIPWHGTTMVGTTETDLEAIESAGVRRHEIDYLRRATAYLFPDARELDPWWSIAGVRSLIRAAGPASRVSRRHVLVDHAADGAAGVATVAGGKLTAWRSIAAEVVDDLLGERDAAALDERRIGAPRPVAPGPGESEGALGHRLWRLYGARAGEVEAWVADDPWWGQPLLDGEPAIRAEVAHALTSEWAVEVGDVVFRRLALGFGPDLGAAAADAVIAVGRERFGWDATRVERELAAFAAEVAERRLPVRDPESALTALAS